MANALVRVRRHNAIMTFTSGTSTKGQFRQRRVILRRSTSSRIIAKVAEAVLNAEPQRGALVRLRLAVWNRSRSWASVLAVRPSLVSRNMISSLQAFAAHHELRSGRSRTLRAGIRCIARQSQGSLEKALRLAPMTTGSD